MGTIGEDKKDIISKTKTLYDAGIGEIIWKNFLAGFSRGFGGLCVTLIFFLIMGGLFFYLILPQFMPLITGYMDIFKSLGAISKLKPEQSSIIPSNLTIELQKLLGK